MGLETELMFEYIEHTKVLVMGYPRAGTHICAVMVAYDTRLHYVHENAWNNRDADALWSHIGNHDGFVTPCPGISDFKRFGQRDDVYVVLIKRPPYEIRASSVRVGGGLATLPDDAALKRIQERYAKWQIEKVSVKHFAEVEYHDLESHPLWIDTEGRKDFTQVQVHPTLGYEDLLRGRL